MVELRDERPPEIEPDSLPLPIAETAPAGRRARVILRKILPPRTSAEDPEDSLEAGAVIGGRAATLGAGLSLREVGLDESPLGIGQALHPRL
jgi:hypothetical protein